MTLWDVRQEFSFSQDCYLKFYGVTVVHEPPSPWFASYYLFIDVFIFFIQSSHHYIGLSFFHLTCISIITACFPPCSCHESKLSKPWCKCFLLSPHWTLHTSITSTSQLPSTCILESSSQMLITCYQALLISPLFYKHLPLIWQAVFCHTSPVPTSIYSTLFESYCLAFPYSCVLPDPQLFLDTKPSLLS